MVKVKPEIIYFDQELIILDKPPNLSVTRSQTEKLPSLQDYLEKKFNLKIARRAGLVHRLDKDTSGVIAAARTQESFEFLQKQFAQRLVSKKYTALVHQIPKFATFATNLSIGRHKFGKFGISATGRVSQTSFSVLKKFEFGQTFLPILDQFSKNWQRYFESNAKFYSLLEVEPKTGRTHQIRVHAKSAGHPVVADPLYLPRKLAKFDQKFCQRLFLHAASLTFTHPKTGKPVTFEAPLPNDLQDALEYLKEMTNAN